MKPVLLEQLSRWIERTRRALSGAEEAQAVIQWVLVLGVIIAPMVALMFTILGALLPFYSLNSWVVALPFP